MMQLGPDQQARAVALIERCAWGSMDDSIRDLESALRMALELTWGDFLRWDDEVKPALEAERNFDDHLFVVRAGVELSDEDRRAYLGGLLQEIALAYGVTTGLVGDPIGREPESSSSPAALLCGLNDISWLP